MAEKRAAFSLRRRRSLGFSKCRWLRTIFNVPSRSILFFNRRRAFSTDSPFFSLISVKLSHFLSDRFSNRGHHDREFLLNQGWKGYFWKDKCQPAKWRRCPLGTSGHCPRSADGPRPQKVGRPHPRAIFMRVPVLNTAASRAFAAPEWLRPRRRDGSCSDGGGVKLCRLKAELQTCLPLVAISAHRQEWDCPLNRLP